MIVSELWLKDQGMLHIFIHLCVCNIHREHIYIGAGLDCFRGPHTTHWAPHPCGAAKEAAACKLVGLAKKQLLLVLFGSAPPPPTSALEMVCVGCEGGWHHKGAHQAFSQCPADPMVRRSSWEVQPIRISIRPVCKDTALMLILARDSYTNRQLVIMKFLLPVLYLA